MIGVGIQFYVKCHKSTIGSGFFKFILPHPTII